LLRLPNPVLFTIFDSVKYPSMHFGRCPSKENDRPASSLEEGRELLCDRITDLGCACAAANVSGADVVVAAAEAGPLRGGIAG
jgi:hypothetical protein